MSRCWGKLKGLSANQKYHDILTFLPSGTATRDPATGKKLVIPGGPGESGFFIQISSDDGVRNGLLTADEVEVVRKWIKGLPTA